MSHEWYPPNMASEEGVTDAKVKTPCCGRRAAPDTLVKNPGLGAPYLCGACREGLFLRGEATREQFLAALGAPAAALTRVRRADAAIKIRVKSGS
jgi:hypothetical protein